MEELGSIGIIFDTPQIILFSVIIVGAIMFGLGMYFFINLIVRVLRLQHQVHPIIHD